MCTVKLSPQALVVLDASGNECRMDWHDVFSVHTYRVDLVTDTVRILEFGHECGEYIEVVDGFGGFLELVSHLHEHLPMPKDYKELIDSTKCDADPVLLFTRN